MAAVLLTNRAVAKLGDGQNKQQAEIAAEDCRAAVQAQPSYTKAHYRLAMALLAAGHAPEAERAAAAGLKTCSSASPSARQLRELESRSRAARLQAAGGMHYLQQQEHA